ncbi:MAG TPA: hypothetical protein VI168_08605 [Croceibacterium sp.]
MTIPLVVLAQVAAPPALPPLPEARIRVFVPPPVPPPPPAVASEEYERQRASHERRLREECYSAAGIKLHMEHWERTRIVPPEERVRSQAAEVELAEAAYAEPLDIDRLERAQRAKTLLQAEQSERRFTERVALLRSLPARDQAIYARGFTAFRSAGPVPQCFATTVR